MPASAAPGDSTAATGFAPTGFALDSGGNVGFAPPTGFALLNGGNVGLPLVTGFALLKGGNVGVAVAGAAPAGFAPLRGGSACLTPPAAGDFAGAALAAGFAGAVGVTTGFLNSG